MKTKKLLIPTAILAVFVGLGLQACSEADPNTEGVTLNQNPKAQEAVFSPSTVEDTLAPGVTKRYTVTLSDLGSYHDMYFDYAGNGNYITMSPEVITDTGERPLTFTMTVTVPSTFTDDSIEGVVHLRDGNRSLEKIKPRITVNDTGIAGGGATGNSDIWDRELAYIETTHADSSKVREALKQSARAMQAMVLEADSPERSVLNVEVAGAGYWCLTYIVKSMEKVVDEAIEIDNLFLLDFLSGNTNEVNAARSRAYALANRHVPPGPGNSPQTLEQYKAYCNFDVDALAS